MITRKIPAESPDRETNIALFTTDAIRENLRHLVHHFIEMAIEIHPLFGEWAIHREIQTFSGKFSFSKIGPDCP
jgi:hypothetical protein